jgi:hypothetical protein
MDLLKISRFEQKFVRIWITFSSKTRRAEKDTIEKNKNIT